MPSKGILCFSYIAVPDVSIEFSVPKNSVTRRDLREYTCDHLEVESSNLGHFKFTGRFEFVVRRGGEEEVARQWVEVNSLTGGLGEGTLGTMDNTPSLVTDTLIITYGFYDAGPGLASLPKQHLCYVTASPNNSHWMQDSLPSSQLFSRTVLPSPHDMGMNTLQNARTLLSTAATTAIKQALGHSLPRALDVLNKLSDAGVRTFAPDIVRALAITQKDSVTTALRLGARYFEFRPAKCHRELFGTGDHGLPDDLYFQHGPIPGLSYRDFLHEVISFLRACPGEIILLHNRWDGVPEACPRPSDTELLSVLDSALHDTGLRAGDLTDLQHSSVQTLRDQGKRLIVLRDAIQVSNYDDVASATLTGSPIADKLRAMSADLPNGRHDVMLLQCQATATNIRDVIVASVLDSDVSTSPILATKPVCDGLVLPLLRGETGRRFLDAEGVVVVLNDFFDGATADVAILLCKERMG